MADWMITLPQSVEWSDYTQELLAVERWSEVMNYRVRYVPKELKRGDRCFLVWRGKVRGWMEIVSVRDLPAGQLTPVVEHRKPAGKYIQRSGPFHVIEGHEIKGFRGIRRYAG